MQSELRPCPFCGRETVKVTAYAGTPMDDDPTHWAGCTVCNAGVDAHSKAEAIAAWNTRTTDAEITRLTEALRAAQEREKGLREALEEISDLPGEINPCNYDHDDACELNRQFCYGLLIASQALAGAKP